MLENEIKPNSGKRDVRKYELLDAIGRSIGWYSYSDECSGNSQFKYKAIYPFL